MTWHDNYTDQQVFTYCNNSTSLDPFWSVMPRLLKWSAYHLKLKFWRIPYCGQKTLLLMSGHYLHTNCKFNLEFFYLQINKCKYTKWNKKQWITLCSHICLSSWSFPFWEWICITCLSSSDNVFAASRWIC